MENDNKISVTYVVPGATRHLKGTKKIPYILTKQDLSYNKLPKKEGKEVVKKGVQKMYDYIWENGTIHTNMTRVAYDYFISDAVPDHFNEKKEGKKWKNMSAEQRLDWHIAFSAQCRGALEFSYQVLED